MQRNESFDQGPVKAKAHEIIMEAMTNKDILMKSTRVDPGEAFREEREREAREVEDLEQKCRSEAEQETAELTEKKERDIEAIEAQGKAHHDEIVDLLVSVVTNVDQKE